jgi:hypothetical protein
MAPTQTTRTRTNQAASNFLASRRNAASDTEEYAGFTNRRTRPSQAPAESISQLRNHPHPETPKRPATDGPQDFNGPDDNDDGPPGGPPDGDGDDPDDEDNPFDRDDPVDPPDDEIYGLTPSERVFHRFSEAIESLARSTRKSPSEDSKVKVREPDTFDGSEPRKLRAFFVQCELNFQNKTRSFRSDRAKVNFAQSYLKGMALEYFEPDLLSDATNVRPDWMDDYTEFMLELQNNFGPHDPVGDAEMQLEQLVMREGQRINKYVVEFQRLASQVRGWGDGALRRQFYNGLPARIKDEICRQGKPATLAEFKTLSQSIDARYWERKAETSREVKPSTSGPPAKSSAPPTRTFTSSTDRTTSTGSKPSKPSTSSSSQQPDLSSKLGKDGKLTTEERQRRMDMRLCLFCGGPGHTARDCSKSTSRAAKGRVATVAPEAKQEVATEAKN